MLLDCDWIMLSANQHLASLYIPRKASYQESTTCSSESHEFESESSEMVHYVDQMDQLSKVDQPGPLDLSTPKDSKNDPKQAVQPLKLCPVFPSMKRGENDLRASSCRN